jgi:hypothetical protein
MTAEQMERAIEFLLEHHSKVSVDIERHSEQIGQLTEAVDAMRIEMRAGFDETRKALDDLIVANEVTRNLAEEVGRLAVTTSQRVSRLEGEA